MLRPDLLAVPSVVKVTEVPLKEIDSEADLPEALSALIEHDLPAVVVRQVGLDDTPLDHYDLTDLVLDNLKIAGYGAQHFTRRTPIADQVDVGIGRLHIDRPGVRVFPPDINIHTTESGSGKAWFANSARGYVKASQQGHDLAEVRTRLHELLLTGQTDVRYMQAIVHVAELATNDSVIFAPANMQGPLWHRFDTAVGPRQPVYSEHCDLYSLYQS